MSNPIPMKKITYSREFLTGPLAGLCVRGLSLNVPAGETHRHMVELNKYSTLNPGRECLTGHLYWNYNVGCEEVDLAA